MLEWFKGRQSGGKKSNTRPRAHSGQLTVTSPKQRANVSQSVDCDRFPESKTEEKKKTYSHVTAKRRAHGINVRTAEPWKYTQIRTQFHALTVFSPHLANCTTVTEA